MLSHKSFAACPSPLDCSSRASLQRLLPKSEKLQFWRCGAPRLEKVPRRTPKYLEEKLVGDRDKTTFFSLTNGYYLPMVWTCPDVFCNLFPANTMFPVNFAFKFNPLWKWRGNRVNTVLPTTTIGDCTVIVPTRTRIYHQQHDWTNNICLG